MKHYSSFLFLIIYLLLIGCQGEMLVKKEIQLLTEKQVNQVIKRIGKTHAPKTEIGNRLIYNDAESYSSFYNEDFMSSDWYNTVRTESVVNKGIWLFTNGPGEEEPGKYKDAPYFFDQANILRYTYGNGFYSPEYAAQLGTEPDPNFPNFGGMVATLFEIHKVRYISLYTESASDEECNGLACPQYDGPTEPVLDVFMKDPAGYTYVGPVFPNQQEPNMNYHGTKVFDLGADFYNVSLYFVSRSIPLEEGSENAAIRVKAVDIRNCTWW